MKGGAMITSHFGPLSWERISLTSDSPSASDLFIFQLPVTILVLIGDYCKRTRGSRNPYTMSTKILITTNIKPDTSTQPISTGRSILKSAATTSLPNPFQLNISSTNTAPAINPANQPE